MTENQIHQKLAELTEQFKMDRSEIRQIKIDIEIIKTSLLSIPQISESLNQINISLAQLKEVFAKLVDYIIINSKYVFYGFFAIVLLSMGVEEIPKWFNQ